MVSILGDSRHAPGLIKHVLLAGRLLKALKISLYSYITRHAQETVHTTEHNYLIIALIMHTRSANLNQKCKTNGVCIHNLPRSITYSSLSGLEPTII